ncbi:MAG TPA: hemolysin III family protein, partial [Pyrinomonadaceae bacterium]|nr:hemolysin III family protein [Pyrinomonadaceae bacterium]
MTIEEVANALTHGLGLVLSVAGFVGLLTWALLYGDGWQIAGSVVYGSSLIILYAASTFYHTSVTP